jgi:hypothetical protein
MILAITDEIAKLLESAFPAGQDSAHADNASDLSGSFLRQFVFQLALPNLTEVFKALFLRRKELFEEVHMKTVPSVISIRPFCLGTINFWGAGLSVCSAVVLFLAENICHRYHCQSF